MTQMHCSPWSRNQKWSDSKTSISERLIYSLRDLGRVCARAWLTQRYAALGVHSSVDIKQDYLDDLRLPVTARP